MTPLPCEALRPCAASGLLGSWQRTAATPVDTSVHRAGGAVPGLAVSALSEHGWATGDCGPMLSVGPRTRQGDRLPYTGRRCGLHVSNSCFPSTWQPDTGEVDARPRLEIGHLDETNRSGHRMRQGVLAQFSEL